MPRRIYTNEFRQECVNLLLSSGRGLKRAAAGSSANSNGVGFLEVTVYDPPTQANVQALVDKMNELIGALRR